MATDALIWDEEQNGKQKKKKETGSGTHNPATVDHSVISYDLQGSNSEPIYSFPGESGNIVFKIILEILRKLNKVFTIKFETNEN